MIGWREKGYIVQKYFYSVLEIASIVHLKGLDRMSGVSLCANNAQMQNIKMTKMQPLVLDIRSYVSFFVHLFVCFI